MNSFLSCGDFFRDTLLSKIDLRSNIVEIDTGYIHCGLEENDVHVFAQSLYACDFWTKLSLFVGDGTFLNCADFFYSLWHNAVCRLTKQVYAVAWNVWTRKNRFLQHHNQYRLAKMVASSLKVLSGQKNVHLVPRRLPDQNRNENTSWMPPVVGGLKCNVDPSIH